MPLFPCCNRLTTVRTIGLGLVVAWFVLAESAQPLNSAPPLVPSISDAQTASVLANTRNASLAAGKLAGAGTAGSPLTVQDFEEIAVIDASVLDTPLDANEQAEGRDTIAAQYRQNPTAFVKSLEIEHKLAGVLLHGSPTEQLQARTIAWLGWLGAAQSSPL